MGCASSKQKRCRHCRNPFSPVSRSYSMHVHHPAQHKGDSYHVVALTSSTFGSLNHRNDVADFNGGFHDGAKINGNVKEVEEKGREEENRGLALGVIEAKLWSKMIEDKIPKLIPKTPIRTPPGEPETINTWELMAGLEDISPLRSPAGHVRSFSFDVVKNSPPTENGIMWLQMEEEADRTSISNSLISDFDPEIISSFRKSLELLPPDHPFHLNRPEGEDFENQAIEIIDSDKNCKLHKNRDRVIVYFTSLRGVRKTYEDCCHARVILKSLGIRMDERDVSMDSGFKDELKELMGAEYKPGLPRVFVGKQYIGGAEEIRRLNEEGQLEKVFENCEMAEDDGGGNGGACQACGDIRFIPCETCSGSCKVYYEEDEEHEEEEEEEENGSEEGEYGFQRCPDCNENGLIRCPICCY